MDNSYELVSNTSECTGSNLSSLSLPTYDEFCDLKNSQSPTLPLYRSDLHEVKPCKNYNKVLQYNAQLESQLAIANSFINSLVDKSSNDGKLETDDYVKSSFELNSKLGLLRSDLKIVKSDMETNGSLISSLKREIEKKDVDICIKNNSVSGLKNKIVELHLQIQGLKQKDMKTNNTLVLLTNELTSVRKSEQWYKHALYECRKQKLTQTEEFSELQSSLCTKIKDFEILKAEMLSLQCKYDELKGCSRQIVDSISKQIKSRPVTGNETTEVRLTKIIEDLNAELQVVKNDLDDTKFWLQSSTKQNAILMSQNTNLQKYLDEKTALVSALENSKLVLSSKISHLTDKLQETEEILLNSHKEKLELQTILFGANQEKWEVTEGINAIKKNFAKFLMKYKKLKENLKEKDSQISNLNEQFLEEKTNNLKELEQLKSNLIDYCQLFNKLEEDCTKKQEINVEVVKSLENKIENLDEANSSYIFQVEKLCQELKIAKDSLNLFEENASKLEIENLRLLNREELATEDQMNSKMAQDKLIEEKTNLQVAVDHIQQLNLAFETKVTSLQNVIKCLEEVNNTHVNQMKKLQKENLLLQAKVEELSETFNCKTQVESNSAECEMKEGGSKKLTRNQLREPHLCQMSRNISVPTLAKSSSVGCMMTGDNALFVELRRLKTLLKAKVMENKENHKRYETNNRTLLSNIKGYRKENNLLQARFKELQTNYNQLLEDLNNCKIESSIKDRKIASLKSTCDNYKSCSHNRDPVEGEKVAKYQKEIESLQIEVKSLQSDLDASNSDKYFLQRICKDLKFSLQTSTSQAVELRKQIHHLTTKKFVFKNEIPSPDRIDDSKILKLLQQSGAIEKPFDDLECSMDKFKEKLVCLQNEILQTSI